MKTRCVTVAGVPGNVKQGRRLFRALRTGLVGYPVCYHIGAAARDHADDGAGDINPVMGEIGADEVYV